VTTLAAQGLKFVIRMMSQIAVARLLTPADYGVVAMVYPVLSLVQIVGTLGLGQATMIQRDVSDEEVSSLFWMGLLLNLVMGGLIVALAPVMGIVYRSEAVIPVAICLAVLVPIAGLSTQPVALLSRNLRFKSLALMDVIAPAVGLVVSYLSALYGLKYWSLVAGAVCETTMGVVVIWIVSRWLPSRPRIAPKVWRLVRSGGDLTIYNLVVYATTSIDNVLLGVAQGQVALGLYDKAYKLVTQPLGQLTTPMERIAIPLLVRSLDEEEKYRRLFLQMLEALIIAATPAVLFVMIDSLSLTSLALGKKWESIGPVVSWLCLGALAVPLHSGVSWLFKSQNRTREQMHAGMFVTVASVIGFVSGLPWGAVGVAAGAGISFFFVCVPFTCWAATRIGPMTLTHLGRALAPIALSGIATAGLLTLWTRTGWVKGIASLPVDLGLAYLLFLGILLLTPGGRQLGRNVLTLKNALLGNKAR
jgi:PST family polysaccharide transporter